MSTATQIAGFAAVLGGIWAIFPPAALILGGVGLVLWGQGAARDPDVAAEPFREVAEVAGKLWRWGTPWSSDTSK